MTQGGSREGSRACLFWDTVGLPILGQCCWANSGTLLGPKLQTVPSILTLHWGAAMKATQAKAAAEAAMATVLGGQP